MNFQYQFQTTTEFDRRAKQLSKKYRRIHEDLASFLQDFNAGRVHGDAIPGLQGKVYKTRMKSSDMQRGKRGGFRVIYSQTEPIQVSSNGDHPQSSG